MSRIDPEDYFASINLDFDDSNFESQLREFNQIFFRRHFKLDVDEKEQK